MANKLNLEGFTVSTSDVCTADGGFVGDVTGNVTGQLFVGEAESEGTVTPAIDVTKTVTFLDATSNGVAATLGAGTENGQIIYIKAIDVSSAVTLTPTFLSDGTTITFGTVNMYITLVYSGILWYVIGGNATVT
jgi:hypothetical protein